jgi:hypothetical protein
MRLRQRPYDLNPRPDHLPEEGRYDTQRPAVKRNIKPLGPLAKGIFFAAAPTRET